MKKPFASLLFLFAVLFCASGIPLLPTGAAFAEMHEHHHAGHADMQMKTPEIAVNLETVPAELKAGVPAKIIFTIRDGEGKPVTDLQITHEKLLHVVIASADFTVFAHIHPDDAAPLTGEMKKRAEYPVDFTFPKAGQYIIAVDTAANDNLISEHFTVEVGGGPAMGGFTKDLSREKRFGELSVTLSAESEKIPAGKETKLKYVFKRNGEPVKDLEPYLSAPMHVAIISSDLDYFVHEHGELPGAPMGHDHMGHMMHMNVPKNFGPDIDVPVTFPARGLYQIFGQVGYKGKVVLISFMVEVQ